MKEQETRRIKEERKKNWESIRMLCKWNSWRRCMNFISCEDATSFCAVAYMFNSFTVCVCVCYDPRYIHLSFGFAVAAQLWCFHVCSSFFFFLSYSESYCGLPWGFLAHTVSATTGESNEVIDSLKWYISPVVYCSICLVSVRSGAKACLSAQMIYSYFPWGKWVNN